MIFLMAYNEQDMQKLLDTLHNWCKRWRVLIVTEKKPNVIHLDRVLVEFKVGKISLEQISRHNIL